MRARVGQLGVKIKDEAASRAHQALGSRGLRRRFFQRAAAMRAELIHELN